MKEIRIVNDINELINGMEEADRRKLKMTKKNFLKKCNVYDCKRKAEFFLETSIINRIKRYFDGRGNYDKPKYCLNHIKEMTRNLKYEDKDVKIITR